MGCICKRQDAANIDENIDIEKKDQSESGNVLDELKQEDSKNELERIEKEKEEKKEKDNHDNETMNTDIVI